jgi:hypothetical protein
MANISLPWQVKLCKQTSPVEHFPDHLELLIVRKNPVTCQKFNKIVFETLLTHGSIICSTFLKLLHVILE